MKEAATKTAVLTASPAMVQMVAHIRQANWVMPRPTGASHCHWPVKGWRPAYEGTVRAAVAQNRGEPRR